MPPTAAGATQHEPPSLDEEESSVNPLPTSYRQHQIRSIDPEEYQASINLIKAIEDPDGFVIGRVRNCRAMARFVRHVDTGHVRVLSYSCRHRWCPLCSRAKAYRISLNVFHWVKTLRSPKLITLTLKHSAAPLKQQIDVLVRSFKRLRQHRELRRRIRGGIWFLQVTHNAENGEWHPHLHVVADCLYIAQRYLSQQWAAVTMTSKIVDIRSIRDPQYAANYVSRYVAKPCKLADLDPIQRIDLAESLRAVRMYNTFGSAHKAGLLSRPVYDPRVWKSVGDFSIVAALAPQDDTAMSIWRAWRDGTPLPDGLSCQPLTNEINGYGVPPPDPAETGSAELDPYLPFERTTQ